MVKTISISCLFLTFFVGLFAQDLPVVTVAKFKNSTEFKMQTTDSVTDNFISLLMDTKRFSVLERERLKELDDESVISGKTKIEGCEYIFLNNISTMDVETSSSKIKIIKLSNKTAEVSVQVNVRIVEAKTGKILHSLFGENKIKKNLSSSNIFTKNDKDPMSNELINNTMRGALEDVVAKIVIALFPVKVVTVKDGQVYLNAGENLNVKVGDEYEVYEIGEALVDVDTGINLGAEEKLVGKIKVTEVKEKYSLASGAAEVLAKVQRGDLCRSTKEEKSK